MAALPQHWRDLNRAELDAAYNNAAAVAHSTETVAGWERRSAGMRADMPRHLDLRYGERERNRIDFFNAGAGAGAPTLVFLHGGYWQARAKEAFTFAAAGPLAGGINIALVGYTLAPDATLDEIVAEARSAIDYLVLRLPDLGANPGRLLISGWSAGAQLAAMLLDHPRVRGGLLISGIYDLEPMCHCYVNDKLRLDAAAARRNSPIHQLPDASPSVWVAVGGAELPELRRQSADYAAARTEKKLPGGFVEIPAADHFSILQELATADGRLSRIVTQLAGGR